MSVEEIKQKSKYSAVSCINRTDRYISLPRDLQRPVFTGYANETRCIYDEAWRRALIIYTVSGICKLAFGHHQSEK